jgi:hypothetical protein
MLTLTEIEAQLTEAAGQLQIVRKAAQDRAITETAEPSELPGPDLGGVTAATAPVGQT